MPVLFWTDILIFFLIALAVGFALYASGKEHLRLPWREVGRSPVAMSALVVLTVYVVIGVMDSIHYKPALDTEDGSGKTQFSSEVLSLFDSLTTGLRERQEKTRTVEDTYSAPPCAARTRDDPVDGSGHLHDQERGHRTDAS